jgi:hypothetical protein
MKNLILYACSFGICGKASENFAYTDTGNDSFGSIVAKELNLGFINRSIPGACNYVIFKQIMRDLPTLRILNKNDILLVQWTHIDRVFNTINSTIMPHHTNHSNPELSNVAEIYYKYMHDDFQSFSQMVGFSYFLNNILKNNYFFSVVDDPTILMNANKTMYSNLISSSNYISLGINGLHGFLKSFNDENIYYPCRHPSDQGHKKLAELYIKALKNE